MSYNCIPADTTLATSSKVVQEVGVSQHSTAQKAARSSLGTQLPLFRITALENNFKLHTGIQKVAMLSRAHTLRAYVTYQRDLYGKTANCSVQYRSCFRGVLGGLACPQ